MSPQAATPRVQRSSRVREGLPSPRGAAWGGHKPWAGVGPATTDNGFGLQGLVSRDGRHNGANGEDDRGSGDLSWSRGFEELSDDPATVALRERQRRNLLGTLVPSRGVPIPLVPDAEHNTARFELPEAPGGEGRRPLLVDTDHPGSADAPRLGSGRGYEVTGRSFLPSALASEDSKPDERQPARESGLAG